MLCQHTEKQSSPGGVRAVGYNLKVKFEAGSDFMATSVEVGQVELATEGEVASGQFGVVAVAEVTVVVKFDLLDGARAATALHGDTEVDCFAIVSLDTQTLVVIKLVEHGNVDIVVQARLDNSGNGAMRKSKSNIVAGKRFLADIVASGKSKVIVFVGNAGIERNLWRSAQSRAKVNVGVVTGKVLLELSRYEAAIRREATSERGLAAVLGQARFADLDITVVAGVPRLFDGDAIAVKGRLEVTLDEAAGVIVGSFQDHFDSLGLSLALELDIAKVEPLAEEVVGRLAEIVKLCGGHF